MSEEKNAITSDVDMTNDDSTSSGSTEGNGQAPPAPPKRMASAVDEGKYGEDDVQVFRDTAHIRERPGMYIGNTSVDGLHHLVYELVYNSVDEALAGYCHNIHVKVDVDGSLSVSDDGRGIPVEEHPQEKRSTLEVVMTTVGAGAKFDHGAYKVSAGLHGIGAKAVTALSEWVEAEIRRNGKVYVQEYERGQPITEVKERGAAKRTGTRITFKPDPEVFGETTFDFAILEGRLRELAFLNKGLRFVLTDARVDKEEEFYYEGGIAEFVEHWNRAEDVLHPPIYIDETREEVRVEVAFQYNAGLEERVRCYANNAYNSAGGTHQAGFRRALTSTLKQYGLDENLFRHVEPKGEDFREGLTAVVSVQVPDPQLEAQTKVRLNNPEVEGIVAGVIADFLKVYLEENPKEAKRLIQKVMLAAEAREAAAKAKKALRDRKSILSGGGLPGKLMDCTSPDRDSSELFLVEGQSAGGSAESGRDRQYQAVLPMRGKVLNVEKARPERLLNNDEICSLISAVGVDIGNTEELEKLRYNKIVILTDADVDGQHIRTLLLTFFYRQMSKLVENGHIYVARPPLFKITQKKKTRYITDAVDMHRELMSRGEDGTKLSIFPVTEERNGEREPERAFEQEELSQLIKVLTPLEENLKILEKRGLDLSVFLERRTDRGLPMFRVIASGTEHWFHNLDELDAFREEEQKRLGKEMVVEDEEGETNGNGIESQLIVQELHEVNRVNRGLEQLAQWNLTEKDLIPAPRIAGREPPVRFVMEHGDQKRVLEHLRDVLPEIRRLGERGLTVTRFKGLGEMDPQELWDTTLDPTKRTLLQVKLEDVVQADEMFRTLMGEKVEPRRDFIHENALDAEVDWHGS